MLSNQDNELMCRVGPGSAQGAALRRFWLPALASSELPEAGGDPVALELLGERLVAFRGQDGVVGVLDEACRHRGASLVLGRVDDCGLRCIYHGWKFAADGTVQETPNVSDPAFKTRFKAKAYPAREAGGMVWVYMGDRAQMPELPHYPFMDVDDAHRIVVPAVVNCNFVQVLEGLVDSSHLSILHTVGLKQASASELESAAKAAHMQFDTAPDIEADETDFGFHYVAIRHLEGGRSIARIAAFQAPCFLFNPNGDLWFSVTPMGDDRALFMHVWWDAEKEIGLEPLRGEQVGLVGLDWESLELSGMTRSTCDGPKAPSRANRWNQDRDAVRAGHFTGILSFTQEDAAVTISSGGIRNRSGEMLAPADIAINRLYKALLSTARAGAGGQDPLGLSADTMAIRGANGDLAPGANWRDLAPTHRIVSRMAAE